MRCKTENHTPESRLELPNKVPKLNEKDSKRQLTFLKEEDESSSESAETMTTPLIQIKQLKKPMPVVKSSHDVLIKRVTTKLSEQKVPYNMSNRTKSVKSVSEE